MRKMPILPEELLRTTLSALVQRQFKNKIAASERKKFFRKESRVFHLFFGHQILCEMKAQLIPKPSHLTSDLSNWLTNLTKCEDKSKWNCTKSTGNLSLENFNLLAQNSVGFPGIFQGLRCWAGAAIIKKVRTGLGQSDKPFPLTLHINLRQSCVCHG